MGACSDDQLLANEDSGWGAYLEGRQRQAARSAAIPRPPDPADLPSSYAESMTSPAQPSPQVSCLLSLYMAVQVASIFIRGAIHAAMAEAGLGALRPSGR